MFKKVLLVFCLTPLIIVKSENCENLSKVNVTAFETIDSEGVNFITENRVETSDDYFHLLIVNQNISQLCGNSVVIINELSVLQLINSSVQDILPGAFNITPTLALIRIKQNPLTTIRKNVFNDLSVKEIDLSQNQIQVIDPEAFDNNTDLQVVVLNENQIKEINPEWFFNSPKVYRLDIIYNELTAVPASAFKNMAKSRPLKLQLSANRIGEVHPEAFNGHTFINLLRISGNKLKILPVELFVNRTINNLQVNTNNLLCFPDDLFKTGIQNLSFIDNISFQCECLKKVRKFVEDLKIKVLYPSIICEDKSREVNIVFNHNRTYEIPLLPPAVDVDVYNEPSDT